MWRGQGRGRRGLRGRWGVSGAGAGRGCPETTGWAGASCCECRASLGSAGAGAGSRLGARGQEWRGWKRGGRGGSWNAVSRARRW